MTGLILLAVLGGWLVISFLISRWIFRVVKPRMLGVVVAAFAFSVLLVAPLTDEIVGKHQFETLCKKYAVQVIDEQHAMNRRALVVERKVDKFAEGTTVRIQIDPEVYVDADTGQTLVSYHTLHAEGGWLVRTLGISETRSPLLFDRVCAPPDEFAFKKKFNITVLN